MKNFNENINELYIFEVDVEYSRNLKNLLNDLPFLPVRMKVKKWNRLVCNQYKNKKYIGHIRTLKQTLNHRLKLKYSVNIIH